MIGKRTLLLLLAALAFPLHGPAQIARGVGSAPDYVLEPAPEVYDAPSRNLRLYTFAVEQAEGYTTLVFPDEDRRRVEKNVNDVFQYAYSVSIDSLGRENYFRDRQAVLDLLSKAATAAGENDVVILYFSGHGVLDANPPMNREYYFIPSDAVRDNPRSTAVSGTEIRRYVDRMVDKGAFVLVFVDTCHGEALFPGGMDSAGKGGAAFFASSAADGETVENGYLRSTPFTETLVQTLQGEGVADDLTVAVLAEKMGSQFAGGVSPKLINSEAKVLLKSLRKKYEYHKRLDRYREYISEGRECLIQNNYPKAYNLFYEATFLGRGIDRRDRTDLSDDISALNGEVAREIVTCLENPESPRWLVLSQLNEDTKLLDRSVVDLKSLYLGSAFYFYRLEDFRKAYILFEKAYRQGDFAKAPFYMATIARKNLPGTLKQSEIDKLLTLAKNNGFDGKDYSGQRKQLISLAEGGDPRSQFILGKCYYMGDTLGFRVDTTQALWWLIKAHERRVPDAALYLGLCYEKGFGVEKDDAKAYRLYKEAASRGSLLGEYRQAIMTLSGQGVKKDPRKGMKALEKLSAKGVNEATTALAFEYYYVKKDRQKGLEYFRRVAEKDDPDAQSMLGSIYYLEGDYHQAYYWAAKSADKDYYRGYYILSVLYLDGHEVQQSDSLYFHYLSLANEKSGRFYDLMSDCYYAGTGTAPDYDAALACMKAAVKYDKENEVYLGELYYNLGKIYCGFNKGKQGGVEDPQRGYRYLCNARDLVSSEKRSEVAYYLANCHSLGVGTETDYKKAFSYYMEASEGGSPAAANEIGVMYYLGEGVAEDKGTALEWLKLSDERGELWGTTNVGTWYLEQGDTLAALPYYRKAAEAGHGKAFEWLGDYYYYGYPGVEASEETAQEYFEKAYERGVGGKSLKSKLGLLYYNRFARSNRKKEFSESVRWCEKATRMDYPKAWYWLGVLYEQGEHVDEDLDKAYDCYLAAYEGGERNEDLDERIPSIYYYLFVRAYNAGEEQKAFDLCRRGAGAGSVDCVYWLGWYYYWGKVVEKDYDKAKEYFDMAYSRLPEDEELKRNLGTSYYNLFAIWYKQGSYEKAYDACRKGAELGNAKAREWERTARRMAKN